jgi:hypothetical protein
MYAKQLKVSPLNTLTSHLPCTYNPALYTNVVKHGLLQSEFFFYLNQVSTKINKTVRFILIKKSVIFIVESDNWCKACDNYS